MILIGKKDGEIEKKSSLSIGQIIKDFKTYTVMGGEFAIVSDSENVALKTLLGSCVAMMFYDNVLKIKAMNHFLLPATSSNNEDMKYGLFSVESMLNEMYKMGCQKQNISVKIAGGADIAVNTTGIKSVGQRNVEFALDFCSNEGFKIVSNHTRGSYGRVVLLTNNFQTFIKTVQNDQNIAVAKEEANLQKEISRRMPAISEGVEIELFDKKEKDPISTEAELF